MAKKTKHNFHGKKRSPGTPDQKENKVKFRKKRKDNVDDSVEFRKHKQNESFNDNTTSTTAVDSVDNKYMRQESESEDELKETRRLVKYQNRKNKKSGGFQAMGLSHAIFKGISRKGYKLPTPIQRKTIPLIIDGKDIVAMARTGSGKTAAFLIPMFEKLIAHSSKGVRAIIMSPTRELAMQTLKFAKELGRFAGLKAAVILGGDRMEDQFAAVHENPDIIIATPGRFLHVTMEMDLKLKSVEYVVFDEADRLFEMGFEEQLNEILHRLPDSRQTLLFSATLPKLLVDFAKAGLNDPTLIRLDVDSKLSEQLKMSFLSCRPSDKPALLLYLLQNIIKSQEQTVIFAATKHHVEFLNLLLEKAGIACSYIYSSCDQTARKISIAKFQHRKVNIMIVTDLAARGIDIPMLDNVINYNFPAKAKLFVHRVGRVARAGRSGTAYSLVCSEEVPYLYDLHVFLGRAVKIVPIDNKIEDEDGLYGIVPQFVIDDMAEHIRHWKVESIDLQSLENVSENAYKNYVKSRPAPAPESVKRMKESEKDGVKLGIHPLFGKSLSAEEERIKLLNALRGYKANSTIFEVNSTAKNKAFDVMKQKRNIHGNVISWNQKRVEIKQKTEQEVTKMSEQTSANDDDLKNAFANIMAPGTNLSTRPQPSKKRKKKDNSVTNVRDEEYYLPYRPKDFHSEQGLSVTKSFEREASGAVLDLTADDAEDLRRLKHQSRWDRKKKKFVTDVIDDKKKKKIRTESGAWIPASYKSNAYKEWRSKNQILDQDDDDDNDGNHGNKQSSNLVILGAKRKNWHTKGSEESTGKKRKFKELKSPAQILKERKKKEKIQAFQNKRRDQRIKRKKFQSQKNKNK